MNKMLTRAFVALFIILTVLTSSYSVFKVMLPRKHYDIIKRYCNQYSVDESLVLALIKAESNFNKNAVSSAGAKGLMQLTDETFIYCLDKIGISENSNVFEPELNIHAGVWYLSFMLHKYDGNIKNALAAYNAGASNVDKWLLTPGISSDGKTLDYIPFGETQRYTEKIGKYLKLYNILY